MIVTSKKGAFLGVCSFLSWAQEWRQACYRAWHHFMWVVPEKGHLENSNISMGTFSSWYPKWWLTESAFDFRWGSGLDPYLIPIPTDGPLTSAHACSKALKPWCLPNWRTEALWHFGSRPFEKQQNLFRLLNSVDSNLFCLRWRKTLWVSAILASRWRFWEKCCSAI